MFLQSCGDDCDDVTCFNGGTCDDGTCECVAGYTGSTCEDEQRAGLIGDWIGNTICPDELASATTVTIQAGTTITELLITRVDNDDLTATVTGTNTFDIEPLVDMAGGVEIITSGDGSINSSGQLRVNFIKSAGGVLIESESCVFTGAQ